MPKNKNKSTKPTVVAKTTNSFFKPAQNENKGQGCVQNVNIEINIDQKEDFLSGCFKAIAGIFKKRP